MNTEPLPTWTTQAKQMLDDSAEHLDASTLSRLNRARQSALAHARPRRARIWFVPAGLASACALLLAAVVIWHQPRNLVLSSGAAIVGQSDAGLSASDLDVVSSDDGIEFYQDLDFYEWLDAQNQDNNG